MRTFKLTIIICIAVSIAGCFSTTSSKSINARSTQLEAKPTFRSKSDYYAHHCYETAIGTYTQRYIDMKTGEETIERPGFMGYKNYGLHTHYNELSGESAEMVAIKIQKITPWGSRENLKITCEVFGPEFIGLMRVYNENEYIKGKKVCVPCFFDD